MDDSAFFETAFFKKFLHSDVVFMGINADGRDFFDFTDFVGKTHKSFSEAHSVPVGVDSETVNNKIIVAFGFPCAFNFGIGGVCADYERAETDKNFAHIHYIKAFFINVACENFAGRITFAPLINVFCLEIFIFNAADTAENCGDVRSGCGTYFHFCYFLSV